jgi:hypothetical protein
LCVRIVVWPKKLAPCILAHEVGPGCLGQKNIRSGLVLGGGRYRHLTGPAEVGLLRDAISGQSRRYKITCIKRG